MKTIHDTLGGEPVEFNFCETRRDLQTVAAFIRNRSALGLDTESTGTNPYRPQWRMRTMQVGDDYCAYVVPVELFPVHRFISWVMRQPVNWIAHNGPFDIRSIDRHLGYETGVICAGETFIPAHHRDSRGRQEGGTGHGLKELSTRFIASDAGKWEKALKASFKEIRIPVPGRFYKSGPRKGEPFTRAARLDEGWSLIPVDHLAYIPYAGSDTILAYRLWRLEQDTVRENLDLYRFDLRVSDACDRLARRGMPLDVKYTTWLDRALDRKARRYAKRCTTYGCANINSGAQIATTLLELGCELSERTKKGAWKTDDGVLRGLLKSSDTMDDAKDFIRSMLISRQLAKRGASYTQSMLREMDEDGRIHPSIKPLGARTARMSVSQPPLQQLPTKDSDDEN